MTISLKNQRGFTLLEMVISIGIFTVVIITTIGLMLSLSNAQIKAANTQVVQDNIRFSMELLAKELRTGTQFSILSPVCGQAGSEIRFEATSGTRVYFWDQTNLRIMRATQPILPGDCNGSSGIVVPFTAEDIYIDRFNFLTRGLPAGAADGQPQITIMLRARAKSPKIPLESTLDLQTTVVPRARDLQ
ncbi:MAG: prepilin-type N-terminal cleavage/methylation domain-containing protein [Candidatus Sungbacteria bacterium]|nr:prepilin-type N-terminal cleavage/methylation domain-containing protein [Candidatus Sungbacteria bacterium]